MEETPKALRVAVVEDDPRIQQLISAEITDEGHACICFVAKRLLFAAFFLPNAVFFCLQLFV